LLNLPKYRGSSNSPVRSSPACGRPDGTVQHLRDALAARIIHYGLDDLDAGDLRMRAPRQFTQEISRYVFALADENGNAVFQGIQYASRLGDDLANWAIFEPNEPTALVSVELDEDDADLQAVLEDYNLKLVD
jgi:hypothetical protein